MRTKAFILVFPFAVFLIETASFIPVMQEACSIVSARKNTCNKPTKPGQCKSKQEKSLCSKVNVPENCDNKKATDNNTSDNECTDNPDCTTCPVCYTFIFQSQFEWTARKFLLHKSYSLLTAGNISSFTPDVWKPPNGFLYS